MEKYGVETHLPGEKQASAQDTPKKCPLCGSLLVKHGQVVLCPKHGSEPFEHDDK